MHYASYVSIYKSIANIDKVFDKIQVTFSRTEILGIFKQIFSFTYTCEYFL